MFLRPDREGLATMALTSADKLVLGRGKHTEISDEKISRKQVILSRKVYAMDNCMKFRLKYGAKRTNRKYSSVLQE